MPPVELGPEFETGGRLVTWLAPIDRPGHLPRAHLPAVGRPFGQEPGGPKGGDPDTSTDEIGPGD